VRRSRAVVTGPSGRSRSGINATGASGSTGSAPGTALLREPELAEHTIGDGEPVEVEVQRELRPNECDDGDAEGQRRRLLQSI
jgi:hypothetical protein